MRVRLTIDEELNELLVQEAKKYSITLNGMINKIISSLENMKIINYVIGCKNNVAIDVKINIRNEYIWANALMDNKELSGSEILRGCIAYYFMLSTDKKEKVIFNDIIEKIKISMKRKTSININYRKENEDVESRKVDAYGIFHTYVERHNYLIAFCHKRKKIRTFRLSRIESIDYSKQQFKENEKCLEIVEKANVYFDSFLSYGQYVKVKLSEEGLKLLKKIDVNRPFEINKELFAEKRLENTDITISDEELKDESIKIFECSEYQFRVYFYQFLDNIYIIEPEKIRLNMIKKFKKAIEIAEGEI